MILVIAEKPSVAGEIAGMLGATKKQKGFYEGGGYYVSWCVGHLVKRLFARFISQYGICYMVQPKTCCNRGAVAAKVVVIWVIHSYTRKTGCSFKKATL